MAVNFLQLPQYQVSNPVDFSPIHNALDSNRQLALANQQNALARRKLDIAERADTRAGEMHGVQMAQARRQQGMDAVRSFAAHAQAIEGMKDPAQKAVAWNRLLASHPQRDSLPEIYRDPINGPRLVIQEAQGFTDPLERQLKQTQIGLHGAHADLYRAQAKAAGQKSEIEGAITDLIRGNLGGGQPPAAAPPQGGFQPQSFGGGGPQGGMMPAGGPQPLAQAQQGAAPPQGDPNLILAQTAAQPTPQAAPDLGPGQDMVDTPMGRMTRQRAQQLGFALALGGKGDAGKMMGDFASQGMPGKEARNEIEKKLFAATEQKARLAGIQQKFKPEWQTLDEQLRQYGISWVDSIGPLRNKIPPAMRARHAEYAQYRQEAYQNINLYIKEITGAQMSEAEANRLRKAVPDPDRDSPTAFQSKLENALAQADLSMARYNYLIRRGFQGSPWESGVSLERMRDIINERGRQIEGMIRSSNPNADPRAVQRETFRIVKQEFGI